MAIDRTGTSTPPAEGRPIGRGREPGPRPIGPIVASLGPLVAILTGCSQGDGLDRRPVSGEVRLDGQPLKRGEILFEPDANDRAGTAVGARIESGRFSVPRRAGPVPGVYKVRIYARSHVQASPGPGQSPNSPRPMVERIPETYNGRTTLTAEVESEGRNAFRFDLQSDPTGQSRGR